MESKRLYPLASPENAHELAGSLVREVIKQNKDESLDGKLKEIDRLINGQDDYLESVAAPETPLQAKIGRDTYNEPWVENCQNGTLSGNYTSGFAMASSYVSGQFLRLVAQMTRANRILEIGMFTGYGAVSMAESDHCEEIVCLEMEPYFEKFLKDRVAGTKVADKLRIIVGKAIDSLQILKDEDKQFDLIFCDADKSNYVNYYKFIMDNGLLTKGGTFLADNALWMGEVFPTPTSRIGTAIYDFNQFVKEDNRVNQVVLPIKDGVSIIRRKDE